MSSSADPDQELSKRQRESEKVIVPSSVPKGDVDRSNILVVVDEASGIVGVRVLVLPLVVENDSGTRRRINNVRRGGYLWMHTPAVAHNRCSSLDEISIVSIVVHHLVGQR